MDQKIDSLRDAILSKSLQENTAWREAFSWRERSQVLEDKLSKVKDENKNVLGKT